MRPNYEKICRICGNYHTELMPIFKNEGVEHDLPKKIKQHFYSVTITELDGLPTQICYQCVSALVSWHDLFELCEEVNKRFRCDVSEKENDSTKNELKISNILADSDNDHPEQSEQDDISNANKTEDKDLIFDLKLEDSNVMLVSMDNVKLDNEFFFKMSPTQNELSKMENDIYEPPGDSMDMEYSDDGGDSREDDLLSLDGNPPSIVLDDFGDRVNDYEGEACSSNGGTKKKSAKKCPKYTTETIQLALAEIQRAEKPLSVKKAAHKYNIPLSTLNDKFTGKSPPVAMRKGRLSILGHENELQLVQWILRCRNEGFPLYRDGLFYSVRKFVHDNPSFNSGDCPFKNGQPTTKWFFAFLRRHPSISPKFFQSRKRMRLTTPMIRKWFYHIKKNVQDETLRQPDRLWVIEMKTSAVDPKDGKVLMDGGSCFHLMNSQTEKETVTAVVSANAAAVIGPRMIVYKEDNEPSDSELALPDWTRTTSICGCAGAEALYQYFSSQFLPFIRATTVTFPIVVFLDSKDARISLQLMELCRENSIQLICFLPDSSHWFHPVDLMPPVAKNQWYKASKASIPTLLDSIIEDDRFAESVKNGFNNCGLYPFNPYKVTIQCFDFPVRNRKITKVEYSTKVTFCEWLERQIAPDLLNKFQACYMKRNNSWDGEEIYKTAFEMWTKSLESELARENSPVDYASCMFNPTRVKVNSNNSFVEERKLVVEAAAQESFYKWLERQISPELLNKFQACYREGHIWNGEEIHETAYEMWVKNLGSKLPHENSNTDGGVYAFNLNGADKEKRTVKSNDGKSFCRWLERQISPDLLEKFQKCYREGGAWHGEEIHKTAFDMWITSESKSAIEKYLCADEFQEEWLQPEVHILD